MGGPDQAKPTEIIGVTARYLRALEALAHHAMGLLDEDGKSTVTVSALAEDADEVTAAVMSCVKRVVTVPRVVTTAADIRELGEAVRRGGTAYPMAVLVDDTDKSIPPIVWKILGEWHCDPQGEQHVWMLSDYGAKWRTDVVTDDGIAGYGPWRVVWTRGVAL